MVHPSGWYLYGGGDAWRDEHVHQVVTVLEDQKVSGTELTTTAFQMSVSKKVYCFNSNIAKLHILSIKYDIIYKLYEYRR